MLSDRVSLPTLTLAAILGALALQQFTTDSVLRGDPILYAEHADNMLAGRLPYRDFPFEHLPLSTIPILIAGLISRAIPGLDYNAAFAMLSGVAILAIAAVVSRIGSTIDDGHAGPRWLAVVTPLLPIVLYRLDPWSTLLAAIAALALIQERQSRHLLATLAGIATKGWPVVLAVRDWLRGERRRATSIGLFTATLIGVLLAAPGFRSGRSFDGVHLETLTGSMTLMTRLLGDQHHGISSAAGALYIDAGRWAILLNAVIGGTVLVLTIIKMRSADRSDSWLITSLILGLLLASPLLSAQFILWLTPFVVMIPQRSSHVLTGLAGALSTALLIWWDPVSVGWAALLVTRNLALVGLAIAVLTASTSSRSPSLARQ